MRRVLLALSFVAVLAAPTLAQAPQTAPTGPSAESIALARRYLDLCGLPDQMRASFDVASKPVVQAVRINAPTMSNDTAARLEALMREEYANLLIRYHNTFAHRLAERMSEEDLRTVVRLMESDPAVARLTAATIAVTPELTELGMKDFGNAAAMAVSRLKRERRL